MLPAAIQRHLWILSWFGRLFDMTIIRLDHVDCWEGFSSSILPYALFDKPPRLLDSKSALGFS